MIDAEHLGSHSTYTSDKNLEEVRVMILKDRRVTTAEMPQTVNVSKRSTGVCVTTLGSTSLVQDGCPGS